jgi:ADP-ribosylglycohydrolase
LAALTAAVTHDGDSDSVGAIVGAWVGAACGYTNLPWFWEDVENADYLFQLATQVSAMLRLTK